MNANETKGLCIALLFVDTLIFGWPPYLLVRGGNRSSRSIRIRTTIISYLTCFAGGVFFGACLLHLLAEGRESMEEYFKSIGQEDLDFPVYECVLAGGFFAIAFVEQIAHNLLHKRTSNDGASAEAVETPKATRSYKVTSREDLPSPNLPGHYNQAFLQDQQFRQTNGSQELSGIKNGQVDTTSAPPQSYTSDRIQPFNSVSATTPGSHSAVIVQHTHLKNEHDSTSDHEHDAEMVKAIQAMEVNPLRAFLLLGALSFHTVFDGLAVGLEETGTGVWEVRLSFP